MTTNGLEFKINRDWQRVIRFSKELAFIPEFASKGDQLYMRASGRTAIYRVTKKMVKVTLVMFVIHAVLRY